MKTQKPPAARGMPNATGLSLVKGRALWWAGVVVLEELEHAKARGATIYAELVGFGMSGDAYHMTSPLAGGEGAARCMNNAMRNAGINSDEIDYVNAHGTSTPLGDAAETLAVKASFGDRAKKVAVSSTKSMTGHLLGAAGGIEAIYTAMAIHHQIAPPTINLENPDPACDLDFVPNSAREMKIDYALVLVAPTERWFCGDTSRNIDAGLVSICIAV